MKRAVDWFRVALIVALAAAVVCVAISLGRAPLGWLVPSAAAQSFPRVTLPTSLAALDRVTYAMPSSDAHPLCWSNGNPETNLTIRFYRYRVEGGPKQLYLDLPRGLWVAQPAAGNFCTAGSHKVPKAGHWIYEAEICFTPVAADGSNCSARVSASCAAGSSPECAGAVGGDSRGWWVYAYLPAPAGPVVD
jgi:hypothetical protein